MLVWAFKEWVIEKYEKDVLLQGLPSGQAGRGRASHELLLTTSGYHSLILIRQHHRIVRCCKAKQRDEELIISGIRVLDKPYQGSLHRLNPRSARFYRASCFYCQDMVHVMSFKPVY